MTAMTQRIDAHHHFWRVARGDYGWLSPDVPALKPLYRDFLPADLYATMQRLGVRQTVVVQAAPTEQETEFLLEMANTHDWIVGVVGWVDLSRRSAVETLERWSREPKFKGVRPMLQDLPALDWIVRAPHPEAVQALVRLGLSFDALVQPPHLGHLRRFVGDHGDLAVVIDHAAKPMLAAGWDAVWAATWRRDMSALAAEPQVMCKLSGLLTEAAGAQDMTLAQAVDCVRPAWDHLLHCFGPGRLIWGSDWPVLTLVADIDRWIAVCASLIEVLPPADQARIWHDNARRFYAL